MSKKKKKQKNSKQPSVEKILLAIAIIDLIKEIIDLLKELFN